MEGGKPAMEYRTPAASLRLARLIAQSPPVLVVSIVVVVVLAQYISAGLNPSGFVRGLLIAAPIAVVSVWAWSIFEISRAAMGVARPLWAKMAFVVPAITALAAGWNGWSTQNSPAALLILASYFFGIWLAASALARASPTENGSVTRRTFIAFLAILFCFVGAWVLEESIDRVSSRLDT